MNTPGLSATLARWWRPCLWVLLLAALAPAILRAQQPAEHPPAATHEAAQKSHAAEAEHEEGGGVLQMIAKLVNFGILAGVLVYFLKTPLASYFAGRGTQIRQELVDAANTRTAAAAQLADIQRKLQELPAELEALERRGAEDLQAERARIAEAAAGERERVLNETRREIQMRLRIAHRQLTELAARLAVDVAEQRITRTITPEDQLRLVDRYTEQLRGAR
jgi:F-type H+-transporting ATPase subunit b